MSASVPELNDGDAYERGRRDGFREGIREGIRKNAALGVSVLLDQQRQVLERLEALARLYADVDAELERELEESSAYWKSEVSS